VEVHRSRRYIRYDSFILVTNAIQVYYMPYPEKIKEKVDWWVVIKTKPRGTVDDRDTLEVAYQDVATHVDFVSNDELNDYLRDEEGGFEEVEANIGRNNNENVEERDLERNVEEDEEEDFIDDSENDDSQYKSNNDDGCDDVDNSDDDDDQI